MPAASVDAMNASRSSRCDALALVGGVDVDAVLDDTGVAAAIGHRHGRDPADDVAAVARDEAMLIEVIRCPTAPRLGTCSSNVAFRVAMPAS